MSDKGTAFKALTPHTVQSGGFILSQKSTTGGNLHGHSVISLIRICEQDELPKANINITNQ